MCNTCQTTIQPTEEFSSKLLEVLNHSSLALMISIGHRTGLFDTLRGMAPATTVEIADAAELDERYVREWLGAMTTGDIVECDETGTLFHLPEAHAAFLTRAAGTDNIAVHLQYVGLLGSVEDSVIECFRNGGGVPYSEYKRFHQIMAEESDQTARAGLVDYILPLAPSLIEALESGIDVLDIGCGSGRAMNLLAATFPNSQFIGYDLSEEAITRARTEAEERGSTNVQFFVKDLSTFDEDAMEEQYDLVTAFDAIHDQARPDRVLAGIHRTLKRDGIFLMQDIDGSSFVQENLEHPLAPFLYTISCMHCMTVSLAQRGLGLGAMWGRQKATEMLEAAGFHSVEIQNLEHDFINAFYVCTKK